MALSDSAGVGSALPSQIGQSGNYLTTDGTVASWATVSGGSGWDTLGAFGSTPDAKGATASGTTLTLQPADDTHPGGLSTAAQDIGGLKNFVDGWECDDGTASHHFLFNPTGNVFGGPRLTIGDKFSLDTQDGLTCQIHAPAQFQVSIADSGVNQLSMNTTTLDLTGLGNGGALKLKSPDGTTYTATIANGGTWSIS